MKPRRRGPDPEIVARVQRAQAGDEQAFSELFEQLQAPVLNYAHQILSDRSSAEDVTQDAFLVAHQRLGMLGPPYDFKSWVYRIAGNLAIDQIRKDRRLVDLEDADVRGEPPTTRRPPEKQVRRGEQQRMIRRSLDRLPPAYRQALVLREIHELSYDELARALDCTYNSARQLVHRARLRFREAHGLRLLIAGAAERCAQLGGMLSAFQDDELSSEAETEVRQHLAGCPHCREQQEDLRAVGAMLAIVPPLLPSPQWTQYVLQQLRKGTPPGGGGGKVNARMVEQPHAQAGDLTDVQGIERGGRRRDFKCRAARWTRWGGRWGRGRGREWSRRSPCRRRRTLARLRPLRRRRRSWGPRSWLSRLAGDAASLDVTLCGRHCGDRRQPGFLWDGHAGSHMDNRSLAGEHATDTHGHIDRDAHPHSHGRDPGGHRHAERQLPSRTGNRVSERRHAPRSAGCRARRPKRRSRAGGGSARRAGQGTAGCGVGRCRLWETQPGCR